MERSTTATQPELLVGTSNAPLDVDAGLVFGDLLQLPPAALHADGKPIAGPAIGFRFTLLPGGDMSLTFPTFADGTPKGLTIVAGSEERRGPRLWLRELGVRQEGSGQARLNACAALADETLWATLLRRSSIAHGEDCTAGRLALASLEIGKDKITAGLVGTAYLHDRDQPTINRVFRWAGDNPVLSMTIGAVLATYIGWVIRLFTTRQS